MHILTVVSVAAACEGGGYAERAIQLARSFAKHGHQSTLVTLDIGDLRPINAQLDGTSLLVIPCMCRRFHIPVPKLYKLYKLLGQVDIIHMVGYWSMLQVLVSMSARIKGIPWVICPGGGLPVFGRHKRLKKLFNILFGFRMVRESAGWIAITKDETAQFVAYGVPSDRVEIVPNGVAESDIGNASVTGFRNRFNISSAPFLLFMGRLNLIKGPDLLLEAFILIANRHPSLQLIFAGPDEGMQAMLTARVNESDLTGRVHFVGFIQNADKIEAYRESSILVVPSRSEAMSIVAVEAGLSGRPVLMTDRCGLDELNEIEPRLTVPARPADLAEAIDYAMSDPKKLEEWGQRWNALVKSRFLWKDIAGNLINWLAILADKKD